MESNNAPGDWNPMGAAYESTEDSTGLREDLRFALQSLGIRECAEDVREELRDPGRLLAAAGLCLALYGGLLLIGLGW